MDLHILIMKRITLQIKSAHTTLFNLLPIEILVGIDIWISGLRQCNKFKHIVSCFKYIIQPILFVSRHKYWSIYYNF